MRVGATETYQDFEEETAEKDEQRSKEGRATDKSKDGDLWFSLFKLDKLCSAPRLRNIFIRSGFVCFFSPNAIKSGSTNTANKLPLTLNEYSLIFRQHAFFSFYLRIKLLKVKPRILQNFFPLSHRNISYISGKLHHIFLYSRH